jgi:hypothetical protein
MVTNATVVKILGLNEVKEFEARLHVRKQSHRRSN